MSQVGLEASMWSSSSLPQSPRPMCARSCMHFNGQEQVAIFYISVYAEQSEEFEALRCTLPLAGTASNNNDRNKSVLTVHAIRLRRQALQLWQLVRTLPGPFGPRCRSAQPRRRPPSSSARLLRGQWHMSASPPTADSPHLCALKLHCCTRCPHP